MIELEQGRIIGSYRVVKCIGQGGMGTVYEVEHVELGVHYALKTFTFNPVDDSSETLKMKFLEEGKVLARLKHPNIAHVFDLAFDEATQMPYFVMDLVTYSDGESYTAADVDPNDIDEELVYRWFKELASALDYIHGEGIVHRDIKPGNLLLDKDLHVILTDFGISRIFGEKIKIDVEAIKTMVSKTGRGKLIMGTAKYMAPEVAKGDDATPEADAYALGVMTLWWLTGFYYGDNPGAIGLLNKCKYRWIPIIAQLVAPTPNRRPKTYSDLVKQLQPFGNASAPRTQKSNKKKRSLIISVVMVIVIAIAGVVAVKGVLYGLDYFEKRNAERDKFVIALREQIIKDKEEAARKEKEAQAFERARKIAEEQRIAEINRETDRKIKAVAEQQKGVNQIPKPIKVEDRPIVEAKHEKVPKGKREFIQEQVVEEKKDYGPIPKKQYTWLANENSPLKQSFQLANGATFDLMPQKATTFYMSNDEGDNKGWHKVTLTRPFWMTRTCVTVDQYREFAPNDCEDCREVEEALDGNALLYIKLQRKTVDKFCAYLTAKYRSQLPNGYVFRLPSNAEWDYVLDHEETVSKYDRPGVWWPDLVCIDLKIFRERFEPIKRGKPILLQISERGRINNSDYQVGGLSLPVASGVIDMYNGLQLMLDVIRNGSAITYADIEIDPLRWDELKYDDHKICVLGRHMSNNHCRFGVDGRYLCHLVVGPDLIGEKAWENKRENIVEKNVAIPKQDKKFDEKKIPRKVSRPREITLKRVGGIETVFCEIPKGKFNMSNVDGQGKACHRVELTKPFWMSKFLVTAKEWREYAPNDFWNRSVKIAERLFQKNPACIVTGYCRWTAYCDFLNQRYGHLLPKEYVFRLPTEAEWEWAFIANEKGDIRKMTHEDYRNDNPRLRKEFEKVVKKKKIDDLYYDASGFIGSDCFRTYIGGRASKSGFGICDLVIYGGCGIAVLDSFDTNGVIRDGGYDGVWAPVDGNVEYEDNEVDPIRYGGRCARCALHRERLTKRNVMNTYHCECAHIVIAPDILKPLKEKEVAPFPEQDFGGVFLGDMVTRADQSSKFEGDCIYDRNSDARFKQMVSLKNLIVERLEKVGYMHCFQTEMEDSPWILLDLGKSCAITGLAIDCFSGRQFTHNLCIWVSEDGKHERLVDKEIIERMRYRIDLQKKNVKGRYIRIGREPKARKDWFCLDKVVIYGKEK